MSRGVAGVTVIATLVAGLWAWQRVSRPRWRWFALRFPQTLPVPMVTACASSWAGVRAPWWQLLRPVIAWELVADRTGISFRLGVEQGRSEFILGQLRAAIPGVRIEPEVAVSRPWTVAAALRRIGHGSLRVAEPQAVTSAILAALQPLRGQERLVISWRLTPNRTQARSKAANGSSVRVRPQGEFVASLRLGAWAAKRTRARQLLRRGLAPLHIVSSPEASLRRSGLPSLVAARSLVVPARVGVVSLSVSVSELTALLGMPIGAPALPGLPASSSRQLPVSPLLPTSGAVVAYSNFPGQDERALRFDLGSLPYGTWLLGPTGSGKSTMLLHLITHCARLGGTVIVFDPKNDLVRDAVDVLPRERHEDLVVIDPGDATPVGLNLLAHTGDAERATDHLVGTLVKLFGSTNVGPRSQQLLRLTLLTLARDPRHTLLEVPRMWSDEAFRRRVVATLDDPVTLEPFWARFEALSAAERAQHVLPAENKLSALLARPALRNMVAQSGGLDLAALVSQNKVVMISLGKGSIGADAASLLGSVTLTKLWLALTARVGLASTQRRPVLLVLDELADYAELPWSIGEMFAQARGLGVGLVVANQHAAQLPAALVKDLMANARTKACFGLSPADARLLADELAPLTADDLQGLERYEVALRLCHEGRNLPVATGVTLPPPAPTGLGDEARDLSRQRYGKPRAEVEAEIRARYTTEVAPLQVGRRRRA